MAECKSNEMCKSNSPATELAEEPATNKLSTKLNCPICKRILTSATGYTKHLKRHESPGGYRCTYCEERFCLYDLLKKHRDETHKVLACRICQETFVTPQAYREHIKDVHDGVDRLMTICEKCGMSFKTPQAAKRHLDTMCGKIKPHACDECEMAFYTKYNLADHKKIHRGQNEFYCSYCGKGFISNARLVIHERRHTGEKPYKCDICGKCFAHRESFVTHASIHTGIKLVVCKCCGARFSCHSNLIKHRRTRSATCGQPIYNPTKETQRSRTSRIPATLMTSEIRIVSASKIIKPNKEVLSPVKRGVDVKSEILKEHQENIVPQTKTDVSVDYPKEDLQIDCSLDYEDYDVLFEDTISIGGDPASPNQSNDQKNIFDVSQNTNNDIDGNENVAVLDQKEDILCSLKFECYEEEIDDKHNCLTATTIDSLQLNGDQVKVESLEGKDNPILDQNQENTRTGRIRFMGNIEVKGNRPTCSSYKSGVSKEGHSPFEDANNECNLVIAQVVSCYESKVERKGNDGQDDHAIEIILPPKNTQRERTLYMENIKVLRNKSACGDFKSEVSDEEHCLFEDANDECNQVIPQVVNCFESKVGKNGNDVQDHHAIEIILPTKNNQRERTLYMENINVLRNRSACGDFKSEVSDEEHCLFEDADDNCDSVIVQRKKANDVEGDRAIATILPTTHDTIVEYIKSEAEGTNDSTKLKTRSQNREMHQTKRCKVMLEKIPVRNDNMNLVNAGTSIERGSYRRQDLRTTLRLFKKDRTYDCKYCMKVYHLRKPYEKHLRDQHHINDEDILDILKKEDKSIPSDLVYRCPICSKEYLMAKRLATHMTYHGPDGKLIHKCQCYCKLHFRTEEEAVEHAQIAHKSSIYCDICDKFTRSPEALIIHKRTHFERRKKPSRNYICDKCAKSFVSRTSLNDHTRSNCGANPLYHCEVCDKKFSTAGILKTHSLLHKDDTPYVCDKCGKAFKIQSQYKTHIKHRHSEDKPFKCKFCPNEYPYRESLLTHMAIHTGHKRYSCSECGKRFTCISNLQAHRKVYADTCGKQPLNPRPSQYMGMREGLLIIGNKPTY